MLCGHWFHVGRLDVRPSPDVSLDTAAMVVAIAVPLMAGLVWLIKAVSGVQKEFKPNGGASARDLWNRTEKDVREIRQRLDDHIDNHGRT